MSPKPQQERELLTGVLEEARQVAGAGPAHAQPEWAYRSADVITAGPRRLLELLYDAAVRYCRQAVDALDAADVERASDRLARARRVVGELQESLRMARPPRGARRFQAVYDQIARLLIEAEFYRKREAVREVISLLDFQRPAWSALVKAPGCSNVRPEPRQASWIG